MMIICKISFHYGDCKIMEMDFNMIMNKIIWFMKADNWRIYS